MENEIVNDYIIDDNDSFYMKHPKAYMALVGVGCIAATAVSVVGVIGLYKLIGREIGKELKKA